MFATIKLYLEVHPNDDCPWRDGEKGVAHFDVTVPEAALVAIDLSQLAKPLFEIAIKDYQEKMAEATQPEQEQK